MTTCMSLSAVQEELREHQMAERSKRAIKHNEAVADKAPDLHTRTVQRVRL